MEKDKIATNILSDNNSTPAEDKEIYKRYLEYRETIQQEHEKYKKELTFCSGLMRFTDRKIYYYDVKYQLTRKPGNWGYINTFGDVVIKPQYIFADDFVDGIAFVCKGEWIHDNRFGNKYHLKFVNHKWGAIDTNGNVVIPFIFNEIDYFKEFGETVTEYFHVDAGDGKEWGHWGIINRKGEWVVPPVFCGFEKKFRDGLVLYHREESLDCELPTLGVYDIIDQKIIIEARYESIYMMKDGNFEAYTFDDKCVLLDSNGNIISTTERNYY